MAETFSDATPTTILHIPTEIVSGIFARLALSSEPAAILQIRLVCKHFRDSPILDTTWRSFICKLLPFEDAWLTHGHISDGSSSYRALYARLYACRCRLEKTWSQDFRNRFQTGKYSCWVVGLKHPSFIWILLFAVRIFTASHQGIAPLDDASSRDAVSLLRRLQAGPTPLMEYNPINSTSAQSWWHELMDGGFEPLCASAWLALFLIDAVVRYDEPRQLEIARAALSTWWGGDRREERLRSLFDLGEFGALAETVLPALEHGDRNGHGWSKGALNSLFWDADGIVCRGVEDCADASCAAAFHQGIEQCGTSGGERDTLVADESLHRLVEWVAKTLDANAAVSLYSSLNRLRFEHGQKLDDKAMLVDQAVAVGADAEEARRLLNSEETLLEMWERSMAQRLRATRRGRAELSLQARGPHPRQRPHLINLLTLGEHASAKHQAGHAGEAMPATQEECTAPPACEVEVPAGCQPGDEFLVETPEV